MKTPITCIYHGNCADGFASAWAVRAALDNDENELVFHPGTYGEDPPDVDDRHVVLVDFSYKRPVLEDIAARARSVLILDHHKSAAEDLAGYPAPCGDWHDHIQDAAEHNGAAIKYVCAIFDMDRSGAGITWDFFHDAARPALIDHVEDRDLWRFQLEGTREIQAAVFSYPYDFKIWDELMAMPVDRLRHDGQAIERKLFKDIAEFRATAESTMVIAGYEVPVLNAPYFFSSDAGAQMAQHAPFAACYWDTPEGRTFSLRSGDHDDAVDVSEIAKQFGGGGHAKAAGFRLTEKQVEAAPFGPVIPES